MVVMDTNSEIYTSMAPTLFLPFQCTEITNGIAMSFHIVTHTLPTSSLTVNSLMTAGSPFFVVTDLTVSYETGHLFVWFGI